MLFIDYVLLVALSAIWGSSFIFMRILAPALGPVVTADMRMLIAGASLALFMKAIRQPLEWRKNGKHYFIIGLLNSGIPFLLFSYAALHLPASISVIINSLTPLFAAVGAVIWLHERFTPRLLFGLLLGVAGVAVIRGGGTVALDNMGTISIIMCVVATMFYGAGGVYLKLNAKQMSPMAISAGSQLTIGLLFLPLAFFAPPPGTVTPQIAVTMTVFAVLCSAVAYIIYYRLMKILGPTKAATVTFLIPVFGFIWGALFLDESITASMIAGGGIVLSSLYFVTGRSKKA
ncbi:MAG: DMT family transporter [Bacteroidetes bacterium]|nr:DMT family transporter [Bacteroidota bacterium]